MFFFIKIVFFFPPIYQFVFAHGIVFSHIFHVSNYKPNTEKRLAESKVL